MAYPSTSGNHNNANNARTKSRIDTCFVPLCPSTSTKFPKKLFLTAPSDPKLREKWLQAARRVVDYSTKTVIRCCEDHFDLPNDVKNWMKYKICGGKLFLKKGVVPHNFECQNRMMPLQPISETMKRRETLEDIENTPGGKLPKLPPLGMEEFVRVKEEPGWEGSPTVELYAQHEIKQEMVVGPEQLQPPDSAFAVAASKIKTEVKCDQQEEILPPRKKRKTTHFTENEKRMIKSVFKYVGKTWPADIFRSKQAMKNKTAEIVGVSQSAVYRAIEGDTKTDKTKPDRNHLTFRSIIDKLDDFDKSRIRKIVHSFYLERELPTAKKVLKVVNADDSLPNLGLTSLKKILNHLKFKYVKRKGASNGIIDRGYIALWRINYLEKIKSCREKGRPVYYLAETWIYAVAEHVADKVCNDSHEQALPEILSVRKSLKKGQLMLLHIGSEKGFLPQSELLIEFKGKDYEPIIAQFENWFEDILSKLEENAVVVMKPSFLSRREKTPVVTWKKCDIQQWLSSKGVSFDAEEKKATLLDKVRAVKSFYRHSYTIDGKAKGFGVEILRLPPFHCELNPVELFWADFKGYTKNTFDIADVKRIIWEGLNNAELLKNCISQVKTEEETYELLDNEIDETIDSGEMYVSDTSDSLSDTDDDDSD